MAEQKVYEPETIVDNALPLASSPASSVTESAQSGGVVSTRKIKDSPIPRYIARETISQTFNTKSRKILAEFQFTESGAIQIGKYVYALSGDLRISPAGIIARNQNGDITFALDGDTGDATFRGIVQAQDFQLIGGGITGIATSGTRSQAGFNDIQDAIEWVYSMGGGRVVVPNGTHYLTNDITLYSNITLEGEDPNLTIIDFQGGDSGTQDARQFHVTMMGTSGSHITNAQVRNLTIAHCPYYELGVIRLKYADWCRISNVTIKDSTYVGDPNVFSIFAENSTFITISDVIFNNPDRGIYLSYVDYSHINKCYFTSIEAESAVLNFNHCNFLTFRDNTIDDCGNISRDSIVHIGTYNPDFTIDNNRFNNCHSGITIWGEDMSFSSRGKIINNIFVGDGGYPFSSGAYSAIDLDAVSTAPDVMIMGNSISGYRTSGITMGLAYFRILDNIISNIGTDFILLDAATEGTINGNVIHDPIGVNGIKLTNSSGYNTVVGNVISGDLTNGIYVASGDKNTITGNLCGSDGTNAVKIDAGSDYNIVSDNQFLGAGYTNSGTGNVFADNIDV